MSDDVIDGGMIDVSGCSLSDLSAEANQSGLSTALDLILAADYDHATSFQSSI